MTSSRLARRITPAAAVLCFTLTATASFADPVSLNVVDVAGNLALTKAGFEAFKAKYPDLVSNITYTNAPAPQLPGKIKAMQGAGRSDIDLVLPGSLLSCPTSCTSCSAARARLSVSLFDTPRIFKPNPTLSSTDMCGNNA